MSYDQLKAVNFSTLKYLAVSPGITNTGFEHPGPRKAHFVIGSAVHCLLMEPGKFDGRFAVFDGIRRGKAWDAWQLEHPDVESLKPDEMANVQGMVAAIRANPRAMRVIDACRFEEATTWIDEQTGLACKGRMDGIGPYVLELKSTTDIAPRKFERQSAQLLYHGQLAFYHDGAIAAHKISGDEPPRTVVVEKSAPYDNGVYRMTKDALLVGRGVYRALLAKLVQCQEADLWPGKLPDEEPLDVPEYLEGPSLIETEEF